MQGKYFTMSPFWGPVIHRALLVMALKKDSRRIFFQNFHVSKNWRHTVWTVNDPYPFIESIHTLNERVCIGSNLRVWVDSRRHWWSKLYIALFIFWYFEWCGITDTCYLCRRCNQEFLNLNSLKTFCHNHTYRNLTGHWQAQNRFKMKGSWVFIFF